MSSTKTETRILDAALALIQRKGDASVTMADIAQAARISRQAVYLHFKDRADLMVALVQHVDEKRELAKDLTRIEDAPSGFAALRETAALQARANPVIWAVARAVDAVRRTDSAAERSWQDRLNHRLDFARQIILRLQKEGTLRPGLAPAAATDLLWTITSLHTWEDLVLQRGWSAAQYEKRITELLEESLTCKL